MLVFAGGIGERSAIVRARIFEGPGCFGIHLDDVAITASAAVISSIASRVSVRVIHTNEEVFIATAVFNALGLSN